MWLGLCVWGGARPVRRVRSYRVPSGAVCQPRCVSLLSAAGPFFPPSRCQLMRCVWVWLVSLGCSRWGVSNVAGLGSFFLAGLSSTLRCELMMCLGQAGLLGMLAMWCHQRCGPQIFLRCGSLPYAAGVGTWDLFGTSETLLHPPNKKGKTQRSSDPKRKPLCV